MIDSIRNKMLSYFGVGMYKLVKKEKVYKNRDYQFEYIDFNIGSGERVLDIGSGAYPFIYGTLQVDLYSDDNFHRGGESLVNDARPLVIADLERLPFSDAMFDFAYCSHVLEHVINPGNACKEIMRVAKRGYIETPTRTSDIMFNYTYIHTWHISIVGKSLVFMPYSEREKKGTNSNVFEKELHSVYQNDFSSLVYSNRDLFCNMMLWENNFDYFVFDQEGRLVDSSK
jgi:SAM-dependent methyltransferase